MLGHLRHPPDVALCDQSITTWTYAARRIRSRQLKHYDAQSFFLGRVDATKAPVRLVPVKTGQELCDVLALEHLADTVVPAHRANMAHDLLWSRKKLYIATWFNFLNVIVSNSDFKIFLAAFNHVQVTGIDPKP